MATAMHKKAAGWERRDAPLPSASALFTTLEDAEAFTARLEAVAASLPPLNVVHDATRTYTEARRTAAAFEAVVRGGGSSNTSA